MSIRAGPLSRIGAISDAESSRRQPEHVAAIRSLWDILVFAMVQFIGTNMQRPMFGDPSGLTDTMWDMIVNALGALATSALGWWCMVRREHSFIEVRTRKVIERNPWLYRW